MPKVRSAREPAFRACFGGPDGLVANEYGLWNPEAEVARRSSAWDVESGSLFRLGGCGWTGRPDRGAPGPLSERGTGSARFRAFTRRADFAAVSVSLAFLQRSLLDASSDEPSSSDGIRLVLRRERGARGYELDLSRRDGALWIAKAGVPLAGPFASLPSFGSWRRARACARDLPDGSVSLQLWLDGRLAAWARDPDDPVRAGSAGLAGDNADFLFAEFEIRALNETEHGG